MELPKLLEGSMPYLNRFFGTPFEIRVIEEGTKFNSVYSCIRDSWDGVASAIKPFNTKNNVYICLNPLKKDCQSKATFGKSFRKIKGGEGIVDEEVESFRWLYIDLDPKRLTGISATDKEKLDAWELLHKVKDFMRDKGFKDPVVCDSGNGFHLHYRIDIPYSKDNQDLIRRVLLAISSEFSSELVDVDRKVFNASRITKLYGTFARKGKDDVANGRPHRKSGFVEFPDNVENEINDISLLEAIATQPKQEKKQESSASFQSTQEDSIAWVRDFFEKHGINYWNEDDGKCYKFFFEDGCPFNPAHGRKDAYVMINEDGKRVFKCFHNSCEGNGWHEFVKLFDENHLNPEEREQKKLEEDRALKEMLGEEVPFEDEDSEPTQKEPDKKKKREYVKIERTEKGAPIQSIKNFLKVLTEDEFCKAMISFDELSNLPYNKKEKKAWRDSDDAALLMYLETVYGLTKRTAFFDALELAFKRTTFNPVTTFLNNLVWDGVERVDTALIDYLGADDTDYVRAVSRLIALGAVTRAFEPGCKFDSVPVLVGAQGKGKSTFCRRIAGKDEFFSDAVRNLGDKDAIETIQGVWICELGELSALSRAKDAEAIKLFTSQQVDKFRPAYARHTQVLPRRCIFVGTTNKYNFLTDKTGNRRFLPVNTTEGSKSLWGVGVEEEFKQILAEAVEMYKKGVRPIIPKDLLNEANKIQEDHLEEDHREGEIASWISNNPQLNFVCTKTIWDKALKCYDKQMSRKDSAELTMLLNRCELLVKAPCKRFKEYGVQKAWKVIKTIDDEMLKEKYGEIVDEVQDDDFSD